MPPVDGTHINISYYIGANQASLHSKTTQYVYVFVLICAYGLL